MVHKLKNILLCVCERKGVGEGTGELIHLFQTVCWGGVEEGDWEGDSLISNCIEKSSQ